MKTQVTLSKSFNTIAKKELIDTSFLSDYIPDHFKIFEIQNFHEKIKGAGHHEISIEVYVNSPKYNKGNDTYIRLDTITTNSIDLDIIGSDDIQTSIEDEDYTESEIEEAEAMDSLLKEILKANF